MKQYLSALLRIALLGTAPLGASLAAEPVIAGSVPVSQAEVDRGRYLVEVGGCHDCHTAGWNTRAGRVADEHLLTGDSTAYEGPWGTRFATNLRLSLLRYTDAEWLRYARSFAARPPMPAGSLHAMSDADLLAVLRYVQWLGPKGEPAPQPLPPGEAWIGPVVRWTERADAR